jgi:hypothetical protein
VLVGCPKLEAYRLPEGPADDITNAAPSASSGEVWLRYAVSYSSVIPDGGSSDLLYVIPKKPTTTSPGTVVVTDGATRFLVFGVNAPPCESIGFAASTFLKSRIAPASEELADSDQP